MATQSAALISLLMSNTATPPQIEIFKPGTYTSVEGVKMTFSAGDMAELVETYDAATNPAPLVIGHPGMDDPAYGWTRGLTLAGDVLVAQTEQVESSFAERVNSGRYKKISAQIYPRDHPSNPTPGKLHLKHIGFFGAHPVAVKGLKTASFSEAQQAGCITIEFPTTKEAPQVADKDKEAELASFAERSAALDAREAQINADGEALAERQKTSAKAEAVARHDANLSFADGQVAAGKLLPAGKDELVHVLDALAAPGFASFGEGEKAKSPLAIVQGWFGAANPVVSFGEFAKDDGESSSGLASFAAPPGFTVDQAKLAHHNRALALQAEKSGLSYDEAVRRTAA